MRSYIPLAAASFFDILLAMDNNSSEIYANCTLCPRSCRSDRTVRSGYCSEGSRLHVARASLHMWEEPCISGTSGSGAVFFSGCSLKCVFCQNMAISRGQTGMYIDTGRLIEIFFELQDKGAHNINLVTADHFIPAVVEAIDRAVSRGLKIPFLFNTSSYITVDSLKMLDGLIDIYLPDCKYIRSEDAARYSNAPDYPDVAAAAIDEMVRQHPSCIFDPASGMIRKGVIIRHLLMPGMLIQAKLIISCLYKKYRDRVFFSLMNQYTPGEHLASYPEIDRPVSDREYRSLIRYAADLGITRAYVQEDGASDTCYIPDFDLTGVISPSS